MAAGGSNSPTFSCCSEYSMSSEKGRVFSASFKSAPRPLSWGGSRGFTRRNLSRKLLFLLTGSSASTFTLVSGGRERCGDTERWRVMANAFLNESHFFTFATFFGLGPGLKGENVVTNTQTHARAHMHTHTQQSCQRCRIVCANTHVHTRAIT